jgi:prevent-host-death family protein
MPAKIGIRELKNHTSRIIHEVHERRSAYIVTLRGRPVAELRPIAEEGSAPGGREEIAAALAAVEEIAGDIARAWKSKKTAIELLAEQRR